MDIKKQLEAFDSNFVWLDENYDELTHRYAEQYVAVLHQKVVAHDADLDRLMEKLRAKYPDEVNAIAVEYVTKQKFQMVL